jgi:predicted CoA-binding protein
MDRPVDMIDVFRRSEFLMGVVKESIALNPKVIWSQLDVFDPDAANLAEENGIQVVMNRCPKIELAIA